MSEKRKAINLWKTIQEQEAEDDMAEFLAMSSAEVDDYIRTNGGDPAAIRARGAAQIRELFERREANAWHGEALKQQEAFQGTLAAAKRKVLLTRDELLARLAVAVSHPRLGVAAASFRKQADDAATDEQLQALLDQLELLIHLDEPQDKD